ncbi:MAG: hypothetical protein KGQ40_13995, partial [Rhodospirillales bacterium]|nr:hypothetical protein [Rhodospirillales bacterium]
ADLTQFDAHGQDLTDTELQARITGVPAVCGAGPHGTVKAQIQVDMDLSRGPAATGRDVGVPYFITIMRGGAVLEQKDYVATTQFPANLDSIKISDDPINMVFPVSAQVPSGAYVIYVGFRLTAAQLAYNRQHPPR